LQPKEYETRVEVIQKFPEMKIIEETVFIKEVYYEERTISVPRTKVIMEENVVIDKVPVIRQVPKTRIEIVHRYDLLESSTRKIYACSLLVNSMSMNMVSTAASLQQNYQSRTAAALAS
jgi:hypothetical protein